MSRTRVKICGLTSAPDRDAAVEAGADALGFISRVPVETPREIPPEEAASLLSGVPPFVTGVLVTMPESVTDAVTLQERVGADAIQIHGTLSPSQVGDLSDRLDVPVIAAVDATEPKIPAYAGAASVILVDSTDDDGGGGTGETHDWARTREIAESVDVPLVLAGGLEPGNVRSAIETVAPFAVDTASGVEREGGRKDHGSIEAFVDAARRAEIATARRQGGKT